ncbi:MAG: hypothetical protein R6W91_07195, partial [Thermoplasmata archaeon]
MFDIRVCRILSMIVVGAMVFGSFAGALQKSAVAPEAESLSLENLPSEIGSDAIDEIEVREDILGGGIQKSIPAGEYIAHPMSSAGYESLGSVPTNWSFRDPHNVQSVHDMGITGDGVVVAIADTGIDFGVSNIAGKYVVVDDTESPYHGWPQAFDPYAMTAYLGKGEVTSGIGGYVNTSVNGTGPFYVSHSINLDGKNDFSPVEKVGNDPYNDVKDPSTDFDFEFDLENLYATRDETQWYFGINTRFASANRTFGFAIDMDGAASGGLTDPYGNYLDFEPSHTAPIEHLSFTPAKGGMLASCSGKQDQDSIIRSTLSGEVNVVKIWDVNGNLMQTLGYEGTVIFSVAWSSDGAMLAYRTLYDVIILDTNDWSEISRTTFRLVPVSTEIDFTRESMAFSPDDSKVVIGSKTGLSDIAVYVLDVATGTNVTKNLGLARSIAYSPDGSKIAMGHGNSIGVYDTGFNLLKTFTTIGNKAVESVAWDTTSSFIAAGKRANGTVEVWNYASETVTPLYGHGKDMTVNAVIWDASGIVTGGNDGKVIFWGLSPFTSPVVRNNLNREPVYSIAKNPATGNIFVGGRNCTIRAYLADWSDYTAFASKKPDVIVYIEYEREYYLKTAEGTEITKKDQIMKPIVYKWNVTLGDWDETDLATVGGQYMYKGSSDGAWTALGFIEWSIPRKFVGWENSGFMNVTTWVCSGDKESQPQDTVPKDCNVPARATIDWTPTTIVGISAWAAVEIPQVTIDESIPHQSDYYHFGTHPSAVLTNIFGPTSLIVVDTTTEGVFDRVYIDMNGDKIIDSDDVWVDKNNPVATSDFYDLAADAPGQDGIADLSGGMLYFIGDGNLSLPYAYRMAELIEMPISVDTPMPIPNNGEFVAFFGDFDIDFEGKIYTQGTRMASVIAGEGTNIGLSGPVLGVSPDVTFLPICNAHYDLTNSLYFA